MKVFRGLILATVLLLCGDATFKAQPYSCLPSGTFTVKDSSGNFLPISDGNGNILNSFPFSTQSVTVFVPARSFYRLNTTVSSFGACNTVCQTGRLYAAIPNNPDFYQNFGTSNALNGAIFRSDYQDSEELITLTVWFFRAN